MAIDGLDGKPVRATVAGIAYPSDQGLYPDQTPGLMWVMPDLVKAVEPLHQLTFEAVGLRLAGPAETGVGVQQAATQLPRGAVIGVSWGSELKRPVDGVSPPLWLCAVTV